MLEARNFANARESALAAIMILPEYTSGGSAYEVLAGVEEADGKPAAAIAALTDWRKAGGWDPAGLPSLLNTLEREEALAGGDPSRISFFANHPATPERVKNTTAAAKALTRGPGRPIAAPRPVFLARLDVQAGGRYVSISKILSEKLGLKPLKIRQVISTSLAGPELADALNIAWSQQQLEQSVWSNPAFVEQVAVNRRQMKFATPDEVRIVAP